MMIITIPIKAQIVAGIVFGLFRAGIGGPKSAPVRDLAIMVTLALGRCS
jgi:hypothetical protein